jgi:hypothetical protein
LTFCAIIGVLTNHTNDVIHVDANNDLYQVLQAQGSSAVCHPSLVFGTASKLIAKHYTKVVSGELLCQILQMADSATLCGCKVLLLIS